MRIEDQNEVYITGMGILLPDGQGVPLFETILREGRSQLKNIEHHEISQQSNIKVAALLPELDLNECLHKNNQYPEPIQKLAYKIGFRAALPIKASLLASLEAWEQAQIIFIGKAITRTHRSNDWRSQYNHTLSIFTCG